MGSRATGAKATFAFALFLSIIAFAWLSEGAKAEFSPYCNNQTLNGNPGAGYTCHGAARQTRLEAGWGESGPVCVGSAYNPYECSGSAGTAIYNPELESQYYYVEPGISNAASHPNLVHAWAETP